jgi:hypothetical protein
MLVDRDVYPSGPDFESLLYPSRFDTPAFWYGLARTNAHTLALALTVVATSEPGDACRADAAATIHNMRREIALNVQRAEELTT